ncbi:MAG TPA: transposase [Gaiellaceae bacterium]|jgi:REP element-mobilizing transposase RayT
MRSWESPAMITSMYRPRIEVPGGFYHVGARGNDRGAIFIDDEDRRSFLRLLTHTARRHGWLIHTYCLMTNHYHLLLQLGSGGLSSGMCQLNGGYALMFNVRHGRSNHVFGRRFWDEQIATDSHYVETCRYVVLNPVRAGLERAVESWPWSSYRAIIGEAFAPAFLARDELLARFGSTPAKARDAYIRHVAEGHVRRQPPGERDRRQPPGESPAT